MKTSREIAGLAEDLNNNIRRTGWDAAVDGAETALRWVLDGGGVDEAKLRLFMARPSTGRRRDWIAAGGDPAHWPQGGAPATAGTAPQWADPATPREPTGEECNARALIPYEVDGLVRAAYACWYPQMGSYSGRAVAVPDPDGGVDVYVWHDGEFPFSGQDGEWARRPVKLHHCDPDQFVGFGNFLASIEVAG